MTYTFHPIKPTPVIWDALTTAPDSSIFFTRQWEDYLHRMGVNTLLIEVRCNEETVGYFVGSHRWLGIRIVTAPSMGTGTYSQGLCMLHETTQTERIDIYQQLAQYLFKKHIASYLQYTTTHDSPISSTYVHRKKSYGRDYIINRANTASIKHAKRGYQLDG